MLDTISFFDLYLLFVLVPWVDGVSKLCILLSSFVGLLLLFAYFGTRDSTESDVKLGDSAIKVFKRVVTPVILTSLLFSAAPNREEIYF